MGTFRRYFPPPSFFLTVLRNAFISHLTFFHVPLFHSSPIHLLLLSSLFSPLLLLTPSLPHPVTPPFLLLSGIALDTRRIDKVEEVCTVAIKAGKSDLLGYTFNLCQSARNIRPRYVRQHVLYAIFSVFIFYII